MLIKVKKKKFEIAIYIKIFKLVNKVWWHDKSRFQGTIV